MLIFVSRRTACISLLIILSAIILFHLLIIFGIIPFDIVWGGRLTNQEEMIRFEIVSILINLIMLSVVAIQAGILKIQVNQIFLRVMLWIMVGLFLLNTIGNLFSNNSLEQIIFTPITILLMLLSLRLVID